MGHKANRKRISIHYVRLTASLIDLRITMAQHDKASVLGKTIANKTIIIRYPISETPVPGVLEWQFHC